MPSQFSAETIARINNVHLMAFETYKRDVQFTFYQSPKEVVVEDPTYNYEFDYQDSAKTELISQSRSFDVCLTYLKRQEFADFIKGDDSGVRFKAVYNRIRIQVLEDAFEYLKDATGYSFGDETYAVESAWRKLGSLGSFIIFEITLQRVV